MAANSLIITNNPERKKAMFRLMEANKQTIRQFMMQWGGVMGHDLIDWTPPRGKNPGKESWPQQKKRGEASVEKDIKKVFRDGRQLIEILSMHPLCVAKPSLLKLLRNLVNSGDIGQLNQILIKIGSKMIVIAQPTKELHDANRNYRGRVKDVKQAYYVPQKGPVTGFVKEVQKDVGKAKAGWLSDQVPVKDVPQWVRRHRGADGATVQLKGPVYMITLRNTSAATKGMRSDTMVAPALRVIEKKWLKSLAAIRAGKKA